MSYALLSRVVEMEPYAYVLIWCVELMKLINFSNER
jgi:hypothetical protein